LTSKKEIKKLRQKAENIKDSSPVNCEYDLSDLTDEVLDRLLELYDIMEIVGNDQAASGEQIETD